MVAGIGVYKQIDSKKVNEERRQAALKQSQEAVDAASERLKEIEAEYAPFKEQYEAKQSECDSLGLDGVDAFASVSKCQREAFDLRSKLSDLETEANSIRNADFTVYYDLVRPMSYLIFYIIGGSIAVAALLGAFIIYLVKGKKSY